MGMSACGPPALTFGIVLHAISDYYKFVSVGTSLSGFYYHDPFREIHFLSCLPVRLVHANYVRLDIEQW